MSLSKFDWYECTLYNVYPSEARLFGFSVLEDYCIVEKVALEDFYCEMERGFQHYRASMTFYDENRIAVFRLLMNEDSPVHFIATGKRAPVLSGIVRKLQPNHAVTRADSALDFIGNPDDFRNVCNCVIECRNNSNGRKLSLTQIKQEKGGETLYLGSMKSESFLRVYDKAHEQRQILPRHLHYQLPQLWTRAEIVVRPSDKVQRAFLSKCEPDSVWSFNPACSEFLRYLNEAETPIRPAVPPRTEDFDRAWWAMLYQYRRAILHQVNCRLRGSWSDLGNLIYEEMSKADFF